MSPITKNTHGAGVLGGPGAVHRGSGVDRGLSPGSPGAGPSRPGLFIQTLRRAFRPSSYWMGETVADAVNGSAGTAAVVLCQIVLPAFTANARVPVVPNVCGAAVA